MTPESLLQGKSSKFTATSFGVNKDIVKDKLSLAATIGNPFTKYMKPDRNIRSQFHTDQQQTNVLQGVSTSLNYRFGELKEENKKNKRGINNDDLSNAQ